LARVNSVRSPSRQRSLNMTQTAVDADARIRLVVAHDDPGVPNWIDTERQPEGMLAYRSIGTRSRPTLEPRVVPLPALREHLPSPYPAINPTARREQLASRRAALLGRYLFIMEWSPPPRPPSGT